MVGRGVKTIEVTSILSSKAKSSRIPWTEVNVMHLAVGQFAIVIEVGRQTMIAHMEDSIARYQVLDEKDRTARVAIGMATNGGEL